MFNKVLDDFYTSPPFYKNYAKKIMELKAEFPFLQVFSIGQSLVGRHIFALGIGNMNNVTLMAGAFHAQEWLTTSLLVRYIEQLSLAFRSKTNIANVCLNSSLSKCGLLLVPMVNPDGVSIALEGHGSALEFSSLVEQVQQQSTRSWQSNARGVDINHNFDAGYNVLKKLEQQDGIDSPSARQYGGKFAHSEPETMAMVNLLYDYNVKNLYAFHSQGEEIFYEYGDNTPVKSTYMARLLSMSSGYTLVKNTGLFSHGGYKDYFIKKYGRPGFTIEIGKGENPLPISMLDDIYFRLLETLVMMTVL